MNTRHAPDGTALFRHEWEPTGPSRSTILLVHGLGEHSGRYEHVAGMLTARGHTVIAPDLRGFGRSGGRRAHVAAWDHYLDDLAAEHASARKRGRPLVLLGHSMGGLVALSYVLHRPKPDFLVLSAPALANNLPRSKRIAARVLGTVLPRLSIRNGLRGEQLSTDPAVGERYFADPLVLQSTTLGLGCRALAEADDCRDRLFGLTVPTLVLHGGDDSIVPPRASEPLAALAGVQRVVLPGLRHEIFNEGGGVVATRLMLDWLEPRL
ncbi:MAG TPA: alpha/beta hydrolase [Acidimicrobiia bacterium]|nr:alpha/beta hydrolase [Acidimicrobiia bacterium]